MDEGIAKILLEELEKCTNFANLNERLFLGELISTNVSSSSVFFENLPGEQQLVEENSCCYYLSLKKILNNGAVDSNRLSNWGKIYELVASKIGICSSDALNRNLRTNGLLMDIMEKCEFPFSLLGEFQSYDYKDPEKEIIITQPILMIPGVEDRGVLQSWEVANTVYEEEVKCCRLFSRCKNIKY